MWLESNEGLINSDYVMLINKPQVATVDGESQIIIYFHLTTGRNAWSVFDTMARAEAAFRHYVSLLTTNAG